MILNLLKERGALPAAALARDLGVTASAIRQHLGTLEADGMVVAESAPSGVGRPTKQWRLAEAAAPFFPDGHEGLTLELLGAMRAAFGEDGIDRLVALRTEAQRATYEARLGEARDLRTRLGALAALRSEEGYMARVAQGADGTLYLMENHCPICAAATACQGLCRAELALFQAVLGPDATVERTEHILTGARRCAYRVTPAN
jgi:predicted ArsR family transcriptional regulator